MPKGMGEGSKLTQFKPHAESLEVRFGKSYIPEPNSGCWLWIENIDNKGYGRIQHNGKMQLAHRISYHLHIAKTNQFVLHNCDNPCCVNPEHLYAGTQKDNMRDRSARNRCWDQRGENGPRAKLTAKQVLEIRADSRVQHVIAKEYGISQAEVSLIKLRKHWGHI